MRSSIFGVLLTIASGSAMACSNNLEINGDECTVFTFTAGAALCLPITTQDGVAYGGSAGGLCGNGSGNFSGTLPNDPFSPGQQLPLYACTDNVVSDVATPNGPVAPGSTRVRTDVLSCPGVQESYFSATWTGNIVYNYVAQKYTTHGSGRDPRTFTGYRWSLVGGSGELSSPQPPPPPPPPNVPYVVTFGQGVCDPNTYLCLVAPQDMTVITSAQIDLLDTLIGIPGNWLTITNTDGTVDTYLIDTMGFTPNGDDGNSLIISGSGSALDDTGAPYKQAAFTAVLTAQEDTGLLVLTNGTLSVLVL